MWGHIFHLTGKFYCQGFGSVFKIQGFAVPCTHWSEDTTSILKSWSSHSSIRNNWSKWRGELYHVMHADTFLHNLLSPLLCVFPLMRGEQAHWRPMCKYGWAFKERSREMPGHKENKVSGNVKKSFYYCVVAINSHLKDWWCEASMATSSEHGFHFVFNFKHTKNRTSDWSVNDSWCCH